MIIMGLVQFGALFYSSNVKIDSVQEITFFFFIATLAGAFMDVIVDGLMVMQAKRDPTFGT